MGPRFPWWIQADLPVASVLISADLIGNVEVAFLVRNGGTTKAGADSVLHYEIAVIPADGDTAGMPVFSLNEGPPGVPLVGDALVAPGDSALIPVSIAIEGQLAGRFCEVVFRQDLDGDTILDPIPAIGILDENRPLHPEGLEEPSEALPHVSLAWLKIVPNPFGGSASIEFALDRSAAVELDVHDASGRLVRNLSPGLRGPGNHEILWDGRDDLGRAAPRGVYFVSARMPGRSIARRAILVRN